jgi:hypothetical protein
MSTPSPISSSPSSFRDPDYNANMKKGYISPDDVQPKQPPGFEKSNDQDVEEVFKVDGGISYRAVTWPKVRTLPTCGELSSGVGSSNLRKDANHKWSVVRTQQCRYVGCCPRCYSTGRLGCALHVLWSAYWCFQVSQRRTI